MTGGYQEFAAKAAETKAEAEAKAAAAAAPPRDLTPEEVRIPFVSHTKSLMDLSCQ